MRGAPAVEVALGPGGAERMLIALLHGFAGAALGRWAFGHAAQQVGGLGDLALWLVLAGAGLGMAALGVLLARQALPPIPAWLGWDGAAWRLRAGGSLPLDRLVVSLDLGHWVLLRAFPADGSPARWHVASSRFAGAGWHAFRVALQAHAGSAAQSAAGGGAGP
jgi:hypothetical protein